MLDEGLAVVADYPLLGRPVALVGIAEKGYGTLRVTAASKGGSSATGLAARYYQAVCLLELGRGAEAAPLFESVAGSAKAGALADSARAMLAQAYEASGAADKAEALWREMAAATDGTFPPDVALLRVAQLLARQGKSDDARRTYQEVVTRFPQGLGASEARAALAAGPQ